VPLLIENQENIEVLCEIKRRTLKTLKLVLGDAKEVLLVGFPSHKNSGDSMIWLGTLEYLQTLEVKVLYQADRSRFSQAYIDSKFPNVPILIHGGGNFGDLWPGFQDFCERVVSNNLDRLVIQLPQSIHFVDENRAISSHEVLSKHSNFIVLMRDHNSLDEVRRLFPKVQSVFCKDLAFGLDISKFRANTRRGTIAILRHDKEQLLVLDKILCEYEITDWHHNIFQKIYWLTLQIILILHKRIPISRVIVTRAVLNAVYKAMAQVNVRSAFGIIKRSDLIITDRLHAHVLATLCGIQNLVLDNSYGKISSMYDDYSGRFSNAKLCLSVEELNLYLADWKFDHSDE